MNPPNINLLHCHNMELMASKPDKHWPLAIVDVEYGIGASSPTVKPCKVKQANGSVLSVAQPNYALKDWDFKKSEQEYFDLLFKKSQRQIIWGGNYYGLTGGYLVWDKLNGSSDQFGAELAWLSFTQRTDIVYYLWAGMMQGAYCGIDVKQALRQKGDKSKNEARIHPTQKPVALYKWLLSKYAKPGDTILDTHLGSGSIAIACHDMGYSLDACEIDADYYAAATLRYRTHISQQQIQFA